MTKELSRKFKNHLYRRFPVIASQYHAFRRLIVNKDSYLYQTGWMESVLNPKPTGINGIPVPWINYSFIQLLETRLHEEITLFEYGSGQSTHFFASKVKEVTSIEYDRDWFQTVKDDLPNNASVHFVENDVNGDYCRSIAKHGKFNVVLVDGRDRVNCCVQAVSALHSDGVVILDDSDRERYRSAFEYFKDNEFRELTVQGLKPQGTGIHQSTLFYRSDNCLNF